MQQNSNLTLGIQKNTKNFIFSYTFRLKKAKQVGDISKLFTIGILLKKENGRIQLGFIKRKQELQRVE